jgi:hypothetical protein
MIAEALQHNLFRHYNLTPVPGVFDTPPKCLKYENSIWTDYRTRMILNLPREVERGSKNIVYVSLQLYLLDCSMRSILEDLEVCGLDSKPRLIPYLDRAAYIIAQKVYASTCEQYKSFQDDLESLELEDKVLVLGMELAIVNALDFKLYDYHNLTHHPSLTQLMIETLEYDSDVFDLQKEELDLIVN